MKPLSPAEVEADIWRLSQRAERVVSEVATRARAAAEADVAYKVAHAKALLRASGTVAEREAHAMVATEHEYAAKRQTEAVLLAAREAGRSTRCQIDALRSVSASLRAALANAS